MKNSTFIAILLTLLMLLMVAAATVIFLLPRQQTLLQENDDLTAESGQLRQDLAQTGLELSAAEATRTAVSDALATTEAEKFVLEGESVTSSQEIAALQATRDALTESLEGATVALGELEAENQRMKSQFPSLTVVTPVDGEIFRPGELIEIFIAAYDPAGITAVNLTLDGETQNLDGQDVPLFTHRQNWRPVGEGDHTLSVMLVNAEGTASDPIAITIQVIDIDKLNASIRAEIEANVIALTGLAPLQPITPTLLTHDELNGRIEADFTEEVTPDQAQQDALVLSAFDFLDADYDLYNALVGMYSDGVLGFYDPETEEFVVVSDDDLLDINEQMTYAHEFVHALQDQHFNLDSLDNENLDSEASAALRALAEGHATLVQELYMAEYLSLDEITAYVDGLGGESPDYLSSVPGIVAEDLMFPYTAGYEFMMKVYQQGGMEAVNAVWADPPQSTEQILHVDRYQDGDAPQIVTLPPLTDTLGAEWHLVDEDTFGEFYLRQYLEQQLDESSVETAALGWGGDRYAVYENAANGDLVMVLRLAWDTAEDADEFMAIYPQYAGYLFETGDEIQQDSLVCWEGAGDVICLADSGAESLVVRAPNLEMAALVAAEVGN